MLFDLAKKEIGRAGEAMGWLTSEIGYFMWKLSFLPQLFAKLFETQAALYKCQCCTGIAA